jgi:hypothetical protein
MALSVPITVTGCTTGYYLDNIPFAYISSIVSLVYKDGRREFEWVDAVRSQRSGKLIKLYDEILRKHQPRPLNTDFSPSVHKAKINKTDGTSFLDAGGCCSSAACRAGCCH